MKELVGTFNQEKKALVGAFSVILKTDCGTDGSLHSTSHKQMRLTLTDELPVVSVGAGNLRRGDPAEVTSLI